MLVFIVRRGVMKVNMNILMVSIFMSITKNLYAIDEIHPTLVLH
jgi:hypothetical protein